MTLCSRCDRGPEACEWCHELGQQGFRVVCDCGLSDLGHHLLGCLDRADKRWVVAQSYESAQEPRTP